MSRPDPRGREIFTLVEVEAASLYMPPLLRGLPGFAVATGLRPSELGALAWGDVAHDGESPTVQVRNRLTTAGRPRPSPSLTEATQRVIPLCKLALDALGYHEPGSATELVFRGRTTRADRPLYMPLMAATWKRACELAGVPYRSAYVWRLTFAIDNRLQGVPTRVVARWLGMSEYSLRKLVEPHWEGWKPWPRYEG